MPWLAETDAGAAYGVARTMAGAGTEAELRFRALQALADLVPADVLTWDRVELATGAVRHEALPAEAEPAGAFEALVGRAADHPLLAAHAACRRVAVRLSELVDRGSFSTASSTATFSTRPASSTRSRSACAPVAARRSSLGSDALSASSQSATAACS